jgi:hypothetical protein
VSEMTHDTQQEAASSWVARMGEDGGLPQQAQQPPRYSQLFRSG